MKQTLVKFMVGILVVPVLSLLGFAGYQKYLGPEETPPPPAATPVEAAGPNLVTAEGKAIPRQHMSLGFNIPGLVEAVTVQQGETVEAGQVIARLKGRRQMEAAVTAAELELLSARQALDELYENAALMSAQARQAVVEAREAADDAQRLVDSLDYTASEEQIEAAEAAVVLAEQTLKKARKEAAEWVSNSRRNTNAKRAAARLALSAAEKQYQAAVARLNALKGTPSDEDAERAEAALALALAGLEKAERDYSLLKDGPDPDQMALAEARIKNAEAQLAAANANLEDLELRAPFSGQLISLDLNVGDVVTPGVPRAVLADLSGWMMETVDLTENDVASLSPGMEARITLYAFPGREFRGVVREVSLQGSESKGTVTYAVRLDFDCEEYPVHWQMSGLVDILLPESAGSPGDAGS